jgi:hypothetical protein
VNCVSPTALSSTPSTRQLSSVHSSLDARAMSRSVRMKHSATDAHNSVSGDQTSPGPPNSAGGAVAISGRRGEVTAMLPAGWPETLTVYR